MNNYFMSGKLMHKASDHNTKRCEVEKWVFLPHSDFERLKANPYQEHEAITAARDLMYEDKNAYHCIMLLDEYGDDGLLIEAEGFDYPRLSMFVPDAALIYERYKTSEAELKLHDMIRDTVEKIAELAHTDKTDFTSADMIDMDEVESLVKNAIVQQLAQRDDIKMAENTDIGVDFQPDIHVEAEKLTELKFYCPLKVHREIRPSFDEDEDEFFEDTEELSDFESLEYESEISDAIEAYQSNEEENRGIMAYLGDIKRFADKAKRVLLKKVKGISFEKDKQNLMKIAGLSENDASDTAYFINEAAAWENICTFIKVNNDGQISEDILKDVITKVNAAVNVSRGMKTEVVAAGGTDDGNIV